MSYPTHKHRCPGCNFSWVCTCADPENHHGFCFECQPATAPPPPAGQLSESEVLKRWDLAQEQS